MDLIVGNGSVSSCRWNSGSEIFIRNIVGQHELDGKTIDYGRGIVMMEN